MAEQTDDVLRPYDLRRSFERRQTEKGESYFGSRGRQVDNQTKSAPKHRDRSQDARLSVSSKRSQRSSVLKAEIKVKRELLEIEEKERQIEARRIERELELKSKQDELELQRLINQKELVRLEQESKAADQDSDEFSNCSDYNVVDEAEEEILRSLDQRPRYSPVQRLRQDIQQNRETESGAPSMIEELTSALTGGIRRAFAFGGLPAPEPTVFYGNPLLYPDWIHSFTTLFEVPEITDAQRLLYLRRYVGGEAREALNGYFMLRSDRAYRDAKRVLEERYGDSFLVTETFRSRLDKWKKIAPKDRKGLRAFSDFLLQVSSAKEEISDLEILDDIREIRKLADKLPDWLFHRWATQMASFKRQKGRYPKFEQFTRFVKDESDSMNDPFFLFETQGKHDSKESSTKDKEKGQVFMTSQNSSKTDEALKKKQETQRERECQFCKRKGHVLFDCFGFSKKTYEEKSEFIKKEGLCFGCLKTGHRSKQCRNRASCKLCNGKHPTCLHIEGFQRNKDDTKVKSADCKKVSTQSKGGLTSLILPVYLSTQDNPEEEQLVYAILDTGSDSTFVNESVADKLKADYVSTKLRITTMTDQSVVTPCKKYQGLTVRGMNSSVRIPLPPSYSKEEIPLNENHIPTPDTAEEWTHLQGIAHLLNPKQDCPTGLLIGYNCQRALTPINIIRDGSDSPFGVQTELGWAVVGGLNSGMNDTLAHHVVVPTITADQERKEIAFVRKTHTKEVGTHELLKMLEQDFQDTATSMTETLSVEDTKFLRIMQEKIKQRDDGYYEMPLPFKSGPPSLPDNRKMALIRLQALKKKFERNTEFKESYRAFMKDIIEKGQAEKVPSDCTSAKWFIPHHGIMQPQKPGKIRVVFDCAARFAGTSLNDHLLQGPDLVSPLVGVLLRFRLEHVAISCDIERMFHQFRVDEAHQNYLCFLWWEDDDDAAPTEYRMKVHLFGAVSSPGCCNFGLKQIAKDYSHISTKASDFLLRNFYVDDGLQSEPTSEKAAEVLENAKRICEKANLNLHKIRTNCPEVKKKINSEEKIVPLAPHESSIERALGLEWDTEKDTFSFKKGNKVHKETRRGMLATVASVYDPLGLIAPFVLKGRQILQKMCQEQLGWDQKIPKALQTEWNDWTEDLAGLNTIQIPRCIKPCNFGTHEKAELHHFSDASVKGYGQCSYLRLINSKGQIHCNLIIAKARVAPLKSTTIPRLELQAAVLSAKVAEVLDKELNLPGITHHFWTDSKVVLGYIRNEAARFHLYVANRVEQIRRSTEPSQWSYIPTNENPADHASRGLSVEQLSSTNWMTGPTFLWNTELPRKNEDIEINKSDPEVKSAHVNATKSEPTFTSFEERIKRFSSFKSAVSAFAVILKCCARRQGKQLSDLEARQTAEGKWIKLIQQEAFSDINLSSKIHNLKNLDPFWDDGTLRVGGRLRKAKEMYGVKHPVILPKKSHLSHLIAAHYHSKTAHQGRNSTMNAIRSSGFWIIGCRLVISSVIHKCVTCIRLRGASKGQKMADLPKERCEPSPPFTHCGVDVFGPFIVKDGRKECKRYGLIFTCLALRAIHIELIDDLSTDAFLNGLRCFTALRGNVKTLFCDQGTNFVGASNELKQNSKSLNADIIASELANAGCEFKFNPPAASHMGGVWERQIRSARNVLSGLINNSAGRLDSTSLRTLFYETTAIVNSRPLTVDNLEDPNSPLPLTPNQLLTMKPDTAFLPPLGEFIREDLYLRKRWRKVQYLADQFWHRWKKEYLQNLQPRQKWTDRQPNVAVDDIVLILDEGHRSQWKLGRVVETLESDDKIVRKVKLLVSTSKLDKKGKCSHERSYLERPVHKVVTIVSSNSMS